MALLTFEQALARVRAGKVPHLLLGNGFSRACREDIFADHALFDRADFNVCHLRRETDSVFSARRTSRS